MILQLFKILHKLFLASFGMKEPIMHPVRVSTAHPKSRVWEGGALLMFIQTVPDALRAAGNETTSVVDSIDCEVKAKGQRRLVTGNDKQFDYVTFRAHARVAHVFP